MKKSNPKKMSLFRETIRILQDSEVESAAGGVTNAASCLVDSCPRTCSYTSC